MEKLMSDAELYQSTFTEYPDVVSVDQLCKMLSVSKATAYRLLKNGDIDSMVVGGSYKIPKLYVLRYLRMVS